MSEPLTADYIADVIRDARRYQGQWTGTAGTLAAHCMRLVRERERMLEANRTVEADTPDAVEDAWARYRQRAAAPEKPAEGTTAKFGTGAVRSDTFEEFRYDLISPIGLREVARTCAEGAAKYSDYNWERGMPVHDLLNHALAHVYQFLAGDRGEPHLAHAAWNLLAAIHSDELWPSLNDGTLRGPGCRAPGT